jgi:GAF domain-containing protein
VNGGAGADIAAAQLTTLLEATRLVSSSLALDDVLSALQDGARRLTGADGASIHLRAPDGRNFVRRRLSDFVRRGETDVRVGDILEADQFMLEAVETGRAAFAPDFQRDPRVAADVGRVVPHVVSSLVAPLRVEGDTLGILLMHWARRVELDPTQVAVVEALAAQAGIAIRNAQLHESLVASARLDGAVKTARAVAHSVNNHLGRVVASAELLQLELEGSLDAPGAASLLGTIIAASDDAARVVMQLQQTLRFVEQPTAVGPALDLERASDDVAV